MVAATTVTVALELIQFGVRAAQASQAGDEESAKEHLRQARQHVQDADDAWVAAAQPGDDQGG